MHKSRQHIAARPLAWIMAAATANLFVAGQAAAQASESNLYDEIVVTAQGRVQSLQDVPVSVSVVSGEDIGKTDLLDLESVTNRVPGVTIAPSPGANNLTIRGVGSSENGGFEQSVGTFVDGVYRGRSRAIHAALFDIERIEVLKGPQTTFFGNNTVAGAISITTRKPGEEFEANAKASYTPTFEEYLFEAGVTVPLGDTLAIRAAGRLSGMDGYIYNTKLDKDSPDKNDKIGRLSLRWEPSSDFRIDARIDYGDMTHRGSGYELYGCPPPEGYGPPTGPCANYLAFNNGDIDAVVDYRNAGAPSTNFYKFTEAELQAAIQLGVHTLKLTSGYFWHDNKLRSTLIPIPADEGTTVVPGAPRPQDSLITEGFEQFSQEIRFSSPDEGFLSYMVGGYWSHSSFDLDTLSGLYFFPLGMFSGGEYTAATPVVGVSTNTESADTLSAFAAATVRPTDQLRINFGLRYTSVTKKASRGVAAGTTDINQVLSHENFIPGNETTQAAILAVLGFPRNDFAQPKRTDDKLLPSVSLQYDLTPDLMAYASYAKGFKAGGFAAYQTTDNSFGPEKVDAVEGGIKAYLLNRKMALNLAVFYSKYDDLQESATITLANGSGRQIVGNVASSSAKGVELSTSIGPFNGFTLSADLAYLNSKYLDFQGAACATRDAALIGRGCTQDLSGKRRAFAPKWSGNVNARYERDISDSLKISFDGTVYFSSKFFQLAKADPDIAQPGFAKIDARIGLGTVDGRWEVAVIGKNLTDKYTGSFRQNLQGSPNSFQVLPDPPRSVGVQVNFRY